GRCRARGTRVVDTQRADARSGDDLQGEVRRVGEQLAGGTCNARAHEQLVSSLDHRASGIGRPVKAKVARYRKDQKGPTRDVDVANDEVVNRAQLPVAKLCVG